MDSNVQGAAALTLVDNKTQDAIEHVAQPVSTSLTAWTPTFVQTLEAAKLRVQAKRDFFTHVMDENLHYGRIPGADKPTLFKPGAELLISSMGLNAILSDAETPIRHYGPSEYGDEAMIAYRRICQVFRQTGPGLHDRVLVAQAEGFCSSRESKYRYREGKRLCPECSKAAIRVSKFERGGFYCNRKEDGCGLNFDKNDARITSQQVGRVVNPDVADLENTILKMADKRAYVAATLLATGCSDIFTQDIEDDFDEQHFGTGTQAADKTPPARPRNQRTQGMNEKTRRKFLETVGAIGLPEPVVMAVVEMKTNKTAHRVTDQAITREQGHAIVDELRSIAKQREEADAAHKAAEAGDQSGRTEQQQQPPPADAPKADTPPKPAERRSGGRAVASAAATATAGAARNMEPLRAQIRALAQEKGVNDEQLNDLAKRASRGYAKSLDDAKFNPRDGQALINLLNGSGTGKYGEPSFAA